MATVLYLVIPVFNESEVLPKTAPMFLDKMELLISAGKIDEKSKIMFVDDGSSDGSWDIIENLSKQNSHFLGVKLSRNRGHQNALLAGLMTAKDKCDITVSVDCDGQDDINAVDKMIIEYENGSDIVYGVRSSRKTDTAFKRGTAQGYYKLLKLLGVEVVYNHADYRLISSRALNALSQFKEVNLYLRGMVPLVGFKSTAVTYERKERVAGKSHYPLGKMLSFALDGVTSLSVKPIRFITVFGIIVSIISFVGIIWSIITALTGGAITGWASTVSIVCFLGGVQILSVGIIGEYIGKIYLETKNRPRYIIEKTTEEEQ